MTQRNTSKASQKNRKGPDNRQRPRQLNLRLTPDEARKAQELAESHGISTGALIREALFGVPRPKRQRRSTFDGLAVGRLLAELGSVRAELGKSGSNLNQIAHYLNADRDVDRLRGLLEDALTEHDEAIRTLLELRAAALKALGSHDLGDD